MSRKQSQNFEISKFQPLDKCYFCNTSFQSMPFKCKYCGLLFCSNHRLPETHFCFSFSSRSFNNTRTPNSVKEIYKELLKIDEEIRNNPNLADNYIKKAKLIINLIRPGIFCKFVEENTELLGNDNEILKEYKKFQSISQAPKNVISEIIRRCPQEESEISMENYLKESFQKDRNYVLENRNPHDNFNEIKKMDESFNELMTFFREVKEKSSNERKEREIEVAETIQPIGLKEQTMRYLNDFISNWSKTKLIMLNCLIKQSSSGVIFYKEKEDKIKIIDGMDKIVQDSKCLSCLFKEGNNFFSAPVPKNCRICGQSIDPEYHVRILKKMLFIERTIILNYQLCEDCFQYIFNSYMNMRTIYNLKDEFIERFKPKYMIPTRYHEIVEEFYNSNFKGHIHLYKEFFSTMFHLDLYQIPPNKEEGRDFYIIGTCGMSSLPMFTQNGEERAELLAFLPSDWPVVSTCELCGGGRSDPNYEKMRQPQYYWPFNNLSFYSRFPFYFDTVFGDGHTISYKNADKTVMRNPIYSALILLKPFSIPEDCTKILIPNNGPYDPDYEKKTKNWINLYCIFPLFENEYQFCVNSKLGELTRIIKEKIGNEIITNDRKNLFDE